MKAAVFGAGGFIGRHLVDYLRARGWEVRAIPRGDSSWRGEPLGHAFFCVGLTADFRARPFETVDAHVSFTTEVLREARFDSFLYCSSTRVYAKSATAGEATALTVDPADGDDLYNLSKLMGEAACLAGAGSKARVARLSNVLGADPLSDNFLSAVVREAVLSGRVKLRGNLASAKDYIAIDDVVDALARIATAGVSPIYNVASGRNTTHAEIISALKAVIDCAVEVAPDAPTTVFPVIQTERLAALGGRARTGVAEFMPEAVAAMREARNDV